MAPDTPSEEMALLAKAFLQALKFCVPAVSPDGPRSSSATADAPLYFFDGSKQSNAAMEFVQTQMGGSVVYGGGAAKKFPAPRQQQKKRKSETDDTASGKKLPKRGSIEISKKLEEEATEQMSKFTSTGAPKLWLHDLFQCILSPSRLLHCVDGPGLDASNNRAILDGLTFCFLGHIMMNGKTLRTWSAVRTCFVSDHKVIATSHNELNWFCTGSASKLTSSKIISGSFNQQLTSRTSTP